MLNKAHEKKTPLRQSVGALNITQMIVNTIVSSSIDNRSVLNSSSNNKCLSREIKSEANMKHMLLSGLQSAVLLKHSGLITPRMACSRVMH